MWVTKGCPKCKGDLYIDYADQIRLETCLQCGFERELRSTRPSSPSAENDKLYSEMRAPVR